MKVLDLKPKYLVLGNKWDDFAKATDDIDFSKEDLCSYVVNLANNFYWLNTESVWGPVGFAWQNYNSTTKQGNGQFTTSNLQFNIIARIPDSYRHLSLTNIFNNLNRELIFLDSDWTHLSKIFYLAKNNYLIDWHIEFKNNNLHVINVLDYNKLIIPYILRGKLSNTNINDYANLILIKENKNNLNVNIFSSGANNKKFNLDLKNIDDDIIDIRDYVKFERNNNNTTIISEYRVSINNFSCKHIIIPVVNERYEGGYHIYLGNDMENGVADEVTYVFDSNLYYHKNIDIINYNYIKAKKFNYINLLNNENYPCIDVYYFNGDFQDETPEITNEIINFTNISVFKNCTFYKKYKYGSLPCNVKIFRDIGYNYICGNDKDLNDLYTFDINTSTFIKNYNNYRIINISNYFEFENNIDSYVCFPTLKINNTYQYGFYDLKVDEFCFNNDTTSMFCPFTSTGTTICDGFAITFIPEYPNASVIIKYNTQYVDNIYSDYWSNSNNISKINISFEVNKDNLINDKIPFSNFGLAYIYRCFNLKMPFMIRCNELIIKERSNGVSGEIICTHLPNLNDEIYIYNSNISFIYDGITNHLNINIVEHILDSIITIGDSSDSSDKTISLNTIYYQNLKEETKNRLLGDGYTIIEQI